MTALLAIFNVDLDVFDISCLVALILFVIAGVMSVMAKTVVTALGCFGLAAYMVASLFLTP